MRRATAEEIVNMEIGVESIEYLIFASKDELETLIGSLNETFEAVDEWEFETRLGVSLEYAKQLMEQIELILK